VAGQVGVPPHAAIAFSGGYISEPKVIPIAPRALFKRKLKIGLDFIDLN